MQIFSSALESRADGRRLKAAGERQPRMNTDEHRWESSARPRRPSDTHRHAVSVFIRVRLWFPFSASDLIVLRQLGVQVAQGQLPRAAGGAVMREGEERAGEREDDARDGADLAQRNGDQAAV